jgi:hypothetical protein
MADDQHSARDLADSWRVRRERALLDADVRHLVDALRPFGVLHRDQLARIAGAGAWHEIVFERALEEAVERGLIQRLPEGFYADAERHHAQQRRAAGGDAGDQASVPG